MNECRPCRNTVCVVVRDDRQFSIQGFPPLPMSPDVPQSPSPFGNDEVYYDLACAPGESLTYSGIFPGWITIDPNSNRLVGAAGVYRERSQSSANSAAQTAISNFAGPAITSGTLMCEP